jgi:hypothetical protein
MDEDTRTLKIEIPPCNVVSTNEEFWDELDGLNGWNLIPGIQNAIFWEGTIDLAGYAREMKTFYPLAAFTQEGAYHISFNGSGQSSITIVSTIPLNPEVIATQWSTGGGPGFLDFSLLPSGVGQQNYETVMFAESQVHMVNSQFPALGITQLLKKNQSGSLAATASDTLYVMKIAGPSVLANKIGSSMALPASRVIIPGKFGTEPDVEYMMRLKRSVELSQQV